MKRVVANVLADAIQFGFIANDAIVEPSLPPEKGIMVVMDRFCGLCLEMSQNLPQDRLWILH